MPAISLSFAATPAVSPEMSHRGLYPGVGRPVESQVALLDDALPGAYLEARLAELAIRIAKQLLANQRRRLGRALEEGRVVVVRNAQEREPDHDLNRFPALSEHQVAQDPPRTIRSALPNGEVRPGADLALAVLLKRKPAVAPLVNHPV